MGFSETQFTETIDQLNQGLDFLSGKIDEVPGVARAAVDQWYIPGFIADAVIWCAERICELAKWIWDKIKEVLRGAAAPILFFTYGFDWQDVRGIADEVAGRLKPEAMPAANSWSGLAASAYHGVIKPQGEAASKLATISDRTASALEICAGVGLAFYVAIGVVVVKFIGAMAVAIAALGSVVFSWAGLSLIIEEAGVNSGLIWAAVSALSAALATQAQQMAGLHGEAVDSSTFPGGRWPDPTTASYADASVKDVTRDGVPRWSVAR